MLLSIYLLMQSLILCDVKSTFLLVAGWLFNVSHVPFIGANIGSVIFSVSNLDSPKLLAGNKKHIV